MTGLPNWEAGERVERFGEYAELVSLLLSQEVTTYAGRYYQVEGAVMNPRPVQTPRPPILIAALGPKMLRHAARFADSWNSLSFKPEFAEQIAETRARCEAIDRMCVEIGRDPATLRRSYTMFDAGARPRGGAIAYYDSPERFVEQVSQVIALGISDVGLYYPLTPAQLPTFERIATDVLPDAARARTPQSDVRDAWHALTRLPLFDALPWARGARSPILAVLGAGFEPCCRPVGVAAARQAGDSSPARRRIAHAAGVPVISISAGISRGSPAVNTCVTKITAGSSPAPRAVWMTSSS